MIHFYDANPKYPHILQSCEDQVSFYAKEHVFMINFYDAHPKYQHILQSCEDQLNF